MEAQAADKAWLEDGAERYQEDENKIIEEKMAGREDIENDEQKEVELKRLRYEYFTKTCTGEQTWIEWKRPQS